MTVTQDVSRVLAKWGKRGGKIGGKSKSPKKQKTARENLEVARKALKIARAKG